MIYKASILKGTFIEGLHKLRRHRMRAYLVSHKLATFRELARYDMFLKSLQSGFSSPSITLHTTQTKGTQERKRDGDNQNVMATDSSATNNANSSPTHTNRAMAVKNGYKEPTTTFNTVPSLDKSARCHFCLHVNQNATTCLILPVTFCKKLMDERVELVQIMPRRTLSQPRPRELLAPRGPPSTPQSQQSLSKPMDQPPFAKF